MLPDGCLKFVSKNHTKNFSPNLVILLFSFVGKTLFLTG
jgi:hypothetical protein